MTVVILSLGAVFMLFAAITTAILSPVESVQNAVSSFFADGDSPSSDEPDVDLRGCLAIDPVSLREVVGTVPPHTELDLAWAWIALRTQEIARGGEPSYDSIVTFQSSAAGQRAAAAIDTDPEAVATSYTDTAPTGYTLAAITGVIDLIQRGILTAPEEDTVTELSAVLADQCSS
ncbi:MAG: hypothetical protein WAW17_02520 [Rhodococcus sp. (in: high G+C Gram-positive bacteria)]|uniref:hypothetical protein n=1 Tax=Rhodococcus sp. TaxID=1831 RepID=UPI003BAF7E51